VHLCVVMNASYQQSSMMAYLLPKICRPSNPLRASAGYSKCSLKASNTVRRRSDSAGDISAPNAAARPPQSHRNATGLQRLPSSNILRNIALGIFFSSPLLFKPGFSVLRLIANSRSPLLNPDINPVLRGVLKPLLYDQFCAGTCKTEILRTRDSIKAMGYSGIILCYGKEIQVSNDNDIYSTGKEELHQTAEINHWRDGNLKTLDMVGKGDWLGIK
jgi:hypothetical protein